MARRNLKLKPKAGVSGPLFAGEPRQSLQVLAKAAAAGGAAGTGDTERGCLPLEHWKSVLTEF